jgi:uncharacterized protein (DUF1697 family)
MPELTRYVALLRGINVGGHSVRMEDLRRLFTELGLQNVRTYIQSGNVFFDTRKTEASTLTRKIERHLREALGFEVAVFLRTIPQLEAILAGDPFKKLKVTPDMRLCIVLIDEPVRRDLELPLFSPKKDMQIVKTTEREAYVVWYIRNGRPPSSQGFLDAAVGKKSTTRFFHTAAKILKAAKG